MYVYIRPSQSTTHGFTVRSQRSFWVAGRKRTKRVLQRRQKKFWAPPHLPQVKIWRQVTEADQSWRGPFLLELFLNFLFLGGKFLSGRRSEVKWILGEGQPTLCKCFFFKYFCCVVFVRLRRVHTNLFISFSPPQNSSLLRLLFSPHHRRGAAALLLHAQTWRVLSAVGLV